MGIFDSIKRKLKKDIVKPDGLNILYKYKKVRCKFYKKNNLFDGKYIEFHLDSKDIKYEKDYFEGKIHGKNIEFFKNGCIKHEKDYFEDKIHGKNIEFFKNGCIKHEKDYFEDKIDGESKTYHENGNLYYQSQYKNGYQQGKTLSFYSSGEKHREMYFKEGECTGDIKEYSKKGDLRFILNEDKYTFYDGVKNIICEVQIEAVKGEGYIELVRFKGLWKNYREDGTVEYSLDFKNQTPDKENNKVVKTLFTKAGEIFLKKSEAYKKKYKCELNFANQHAVHRMDKVTLKPITSIEDIIEFK